MFNSTDTDCNVSGLRLDYDGQVWEYDEGECIDFWFANAHVYHMFWSV